MVDIYNQFKDFKSFEVSFLSSENELQRLLCTIKSIENNRIILDANNQKNKGVFANVGDELKLHIYTENGIYSATSKVLLVTKGILNTEYIIAYPANSKHSQRREYFRAEKMVNFSMELQTKDTAQNSITIEGLTKNICGKGMSYVSNAPFEDYESIEITLNFEEFAIETSASLVYSKQIIINDKPKFIHAFTFTNISQKNIDFIVKKCFLHQLDLKKKMS